jgi:hypothetical protein
MRSLLARLWLLVPLFLLMQGSAAASTSACPVVQPSALYLPDDSAPPLGYPIEEGASIESSDDDASSDGDLGARAAGWSDGGATLAARVPPSAAWLPTVTDRRAVDLVFRTMALPLRGPPRSKTP